MPNAGWGLRFKCLTIAGVIVAPAGVRAQPMSPIEIKIAPGGRIFVHEVNRGFGVTDLLIQNVAIINRGADSVTLESVRFDLVWRGESVVSNTIERSMLEPLWSRLYQLLVVDNRLTRNKAIFFTDSLLAGGVTVAARTTLGPGQAIILGRRPMTMTFVVPDSLRVTVEGTIAGERAVGRHAIPVFRHRSVSPYAFPLEGRWFVASSAALPSHHRWRPASEFALDFVRIGEGGSTHRGAGTRHEDYYSFGEPVLAAAAGHVVYARDGARETPLPLVGESRSDFARRVLDSLWREDPDGKLADGNVVVIAHPGGEYSTYAHLKRGSVLVARGDSVRAGQRIGAVGLSGDGYEPHLHFQITAGSDQHFSRGLPVVFDDVVPIGLSSTIDGEGKRPLSTGEFVEPRRPPR